MKDAITNWRLDKAAARLLGGRTQMNPPPDWMCWAEPALALPIDYLLTGLIKSNRAPRMRSRKELESFGIRCPYYTTRWAISMAVDAATVAAQDDPVEMAQRWRLHGQAAEQAATAIATLAQSLMTKPPVTRWPMRESAEIGVTYNAIVALHRGARLKRLAAHARQARQVFQNNQGEVWRVVFAADLGFTWRVLTATNPARTDPFIDFMAAAFESLVDDSAPMSWEKPVRRALDMSLDWDRYEKILPKPKAKT